MGISYSSHHIHNSFIRIPHNPIGLGEGGGADVINCQCLVPLPISLTGKHNARRGFLRTSAQERGQRNYHNIFTGARQEGACHFLTYYMSDYSFVIVWKNY